MESNSILSFIFGIASLFILGIPFGLAAIILGALGLSKIAKDESKRGAALAVIGMIVGTVSVILVLIVLSSI